MQENKNTIVDYSIAGSVGFITGGLNPLSALGSVFFLKFISKQTKSKKSKWFAWFGAGVISWFPLLIPWSLLMNSLPTETQNTVVELQPTPEVKRQELAEQERLSKIAAAEQESLARIEEAEQAAKEQAEEQKREEEIEATRLEAERLAEIESQVEPGEQELYATNAEVLEFAIQQLPEDEILAFCEGFSFSPDFMWSLFYEGLDADIKSLITQEDFNEAASRVCN